MREIMVGADHMVGSRHPDYDELMEMGADHPSHRSTALARHPASAHPASHATYGGHPQQQPHPMHASHGHGGHPMHAQPHHEPHHEQHNGYHPDGYGSHQQPLPARRRIVSEEPTHERLFPIGFIQTQVGPGDEVEIEVKPQVYFRGERLAIPPTLARYFDIVDIKVGKDSQLAATGAMPGESFSALAVGVRMELSTAKPGIVITLRVKNNDTNPQDFKAVMYGAVLE